jgi:transposase-like protein
MPPKRHNSYTAAFKMQAIEKAEAIGNRAAAREFGVDERCIRRWRSEKAVLESMPKTKRARRCGTAHWPELEDVLEKWILEQREKGLPLSTVQIRLQAKNFAANMGISNFTGNPNWCFRFMARKKLSVRARTTVGQSLPDDWEDKKKSFLQYVENAVSGKKLHKSQIINMDEVPMSFDCPPTRTVCKTGEKTVSIVTSGHEKTAFTCVLACAANGEKLKPMLIFKRKTLPRGNFPADVLIRCNPKGWMCESIMLDWMNEVWRKRKGSFFQPSGILVLDSMRAHLLESVKVAAKKASATLAVIPGGLTKVLQPLDLTVNKSFKGHVRNQWESWMAKENHEYTKGGKMKRASYEEVAKWVSQAWAKVSTQTVESGFSQAGIISDKITHISDDEEEEDVRLNEELLRLFNSDSEASDFDGFSESEF